MKDSKLTAGELFRSVSKILGFSACILILFYDLFVSASFALIDEWIYQFETVILGLAILFSPFACYFGLRFGNKVKMKSFHHPTLILWALIMSTVLWRLLTTLNHLNGAAYYDLSFIFFTFFSIPFSLFSISTLLPNIFADSDEKIQKYLPLSGFLIAAIVAIIFRNLAYYYAVTGNMLLLSLFDLINSKNKSSKGEHIENTSTKIKEALIEDNLNISGLIILLILSSIFVGLNFWSTAKISIFSIDGHGFFEFHFLISSIGAFLTIWGITKIKKPAIFRLFTSIFLITLLILSFVYFKATEANVVKTSFTIATTAGSLFSGYAITLILYCLKGYFIELTRNRRIKLLFLSFGFVLSQIGVVITFYLPTEQISKEMLLSIIIILAVFGIFAATFGGNWSAINKIIQKMKPKHSLQMKIPCILLFGLLIGNILSGSIELHGESVSTSPFQMPIPATSSESGEIYNYNSPAFRSPFGSCTHNDETPEIIQDHKAAGFGWWRKDWNWDGFQKDNSSDWNFQGFDQLVQHFNINDMYMIPLVSYVPKWACNNTGKYCDQLLEEWKTFVRTIVSRYAGNKSITCWEIWNEPNINSEIFYDPYIYSLLLIEAGKIIRELDPKSLILAGGTSSMNLGNWGWYKKIFELNTTGPEEVKGKIIFDVINLHLYQQTYRGALYEIMEMRNLADSYGFTIHSSGRGAIWITETGKFTKEENWPSDHMYQAEFLSKVAVSSLYSGVAKIFYYVWFGEQYFGIMHSEHKGKPAYYHLQTIHHLLMNATPIPIHSTPSMTRDAKVLPENQNSPIKINVKGFNGVFNPIVHAFPFLINENNGSDETIKIAFIFWLDGSVDSTVSLRISEKTGKIKEIVKLQPAEVIKWPPKEEGWLIPAQNISLAPNIIIDINGTLPHYYTLMFERVGQQNSIEFDLIIVSARSTFILLGVSIGLVVVVNLSIAIMYFKNRMKQRPDTIN